MSEFRSIADIMKKRRKLLGINQDALAEIAGVSVRTVKAIESDTANPSIRLLLKILGALGLTLRVTARS